MGEVGTKLAFENERRSTLEVTRANGRVDRVALEAGTGYDRDPGDTPGARNVGPTRCHAVLVELKG